MATKNPKPISKQKRQTEQFQRMTTASNDAFIRHSILGKEFDTYTPTQKKMARNVFKESSKYFDYNKKGKARDFIAKGPNIGEDNPYKGKTFTVEQMANLIREALPLYHSPDTMAEGVKSRQVDPLLQSGMILETRESIDKEKTFDFFGLPKGLKPVDIREGGRGLPSLEERIENRYRPLDGVGGEFFPDSRKLAEGGRAGMSNDKITQILQQMHEMSDEPVKKMQSGGLVYTPQQYAAANVDYFSPFSIQVDVPDPGDDTDDDDRDVNINIQEPVTGGDDAPDIFAGVNLKTGQSGVSYSKINAKDYIKDFETKEAEFKDLTDKAFDSGKGFSDYLSKQAQRTGAPVTGVVGLATGLPIAPLAAGMAKLNRQQHYNTANAIAAQGGGDILEANNQTLSRKPGSKIVNGTLGNMTQEQAQRFVAIANGYIPGTYKDEERGGEEGGYVKTGHDALVHVDGNFAMDAFGNIHSAGGSQRETATQAQTAREILFEREMKENGYGAKLEELRREGKFSKAAQEFKNTFNNTMKSGRPFFGTTAGMSSAAYADSLNSAKSNIKNILENTYGASKVKDDTSGDSDTPSGTSYSITKDPMYSKTAVDAQVMGDDGFVSDPSFKDALIKGMEESPGRDPSLGTVYDPTATVSLTTTTDASPPSDDSDDDDDDRGGGGGFTDSAGDSGISGSPEGEAGVDYDEDDFIDESGEFTEGFKEDDNDSDDKDDTGCVIATHGLSTGGFTPMEKAKAELWCQKTYHGKWYGEAFRRGYRAAGQRAIDSGNAEKYYQEFKDFVAYGRGVKRGWRLGFNYYRRTLSFFLSGLFISE
jgi:hypothetical protein